MKFKHVVASLSLAMFAAFVAAAGLSMKKEAKAVKAEGEDWMFRISVNLQEASSWTGNDTVKNLRFHYWGKDGGVDYNATVSLSLQNGSAHYGYHGEFSELVYGTNVVLSASKSVEGGCFILDQDSSRLNNYSKDLTNCTFEKDGGVFVRQYSYLEWDGEKWACGASTYATAPRYICGSASIPFVANTAKNRWECKDIEYDHTGTTSSMYYSFQIGDEYANSVIDHDSYERYGVYGADYSACWSTFAYSGTYDFYLEAESDGYGQMFVEKHGEEKETYIYYLSESNFGEGETPNNIYAYGGAEQFGAWPGTPIASIATEVTNHGVLRFDGVYNGDQSQYIYKIPVKIGSSTGDLKIIINYLGTSKGSDQELVARSAYTWSSRSSYKGAALDLLVEAEKVRNSVEASGDIKKYSVCGISKADASSLYEEYDDIESYEVKRYIDESYAYTYAEDGSERNELVSYAKIMERIGIIAGVLTDPSASRFSVFGFENNSIALIIVAVTATSALSFTLLLVFKKKRHK